jgi:hypothetical protein
MALQKVGDWDSCWDFAKAARRVGRWATMRDWRLAAWKAGMTAGCSVAKMAASKASYWAAQTDRRMVGGTAALWVDLWATPRDISTAARMAVVMACCLVPVTAGPMVAQTELHWVVRRAVLTGGGWVVHWVAAMADLSARSRADQTDRRMVGETVAWMAASWDSN